MFEKEAEEYIKANNLEWELECHRTSPIGEVKHAFQKGAEFGYNKTLKETWHYPSKGEYPEKGKGILLYTKTLGLIFGEFCKGYNNLWTSNRCDFTTEEIIAWIEKEKILPKGE